MKSIRLDIILLLFLIICVSCRTEDDRNVIPIIKYVGDNSLIIDNISAVNSSKIRVCATFNLAYDSTEKEIGMELFNQDNELVERKLFQTNKIKSKEFVYFEGLKAGTYHVQSYFYFDNMTDTVYSNTKSITIKNLEYNDYLITSYPEYVTMDNKSVYTRTNGKSIIFFFHTDELLYTEDLMLKLNDSLIIKPVEGEPFSSELKKYEYQIMFYVTDKIPVGQYDIELIHSGSVYKTGCTLDKLSGNWERIKSLFSGVLEGGPRLYFQSGKYGYIGIGNYRNYEFSTININRFDLENFSWAQMKTLDVSPRRIVDFDVGAVFDNTYYCFITTYRSYDKYTYELWSYDIAANEWSFVTKQPTLADTVRLDCPLTFYLNDKLYFAGGSLITGGVAYPQKDVWCYDIKQKKWTVNTNSLPFDFSRISYYCSIFSSETSAYVLFNDKSDTDIVFWKFTELDHSWKKMTLPYPLITFGGVTQYHNGQFHYIGPNNYYIYTEKNNTWKQYASLPNNYNGGAAFFYNNQLFVGIGFGSYESTVSMFRFKE